MKKMGSVRDLMGKIPGLNQMSVDLDGIDADSEVKRIQGIIDSMTPAERSRPDMIDISRRRRIAAGAGVDPSDVSGLVKQFDAMAAFVRSMSQMSMLDKIRALTGLGRAAAINPGARLFAPKVGTGKRLSPKEREKLRKQREKEERKRRREERDRPGHDPPQYPDGPTPHVRRTPGPQVLKSITELMSDRPTRNDSRRARRRTRGSGSEWTSPT